MSGSNIYNSNKEQELGCENPAPASNGVLCPSCGWDMVDGINPRDINKPVSSAIGVQTNQIPMYCPQCGQKGFKVS